MAFWIIYILVQILFLGTALGHFSQYFLFIFRLQTTMVVDFYSPPLPSPQYKKAYYDPAVKTGA